MSAKIKTASADVNTRPTEGTERRLATTKKGACAGRRSTSPLSSQRGSVRKGTDANGKQWESKMHNTYGYFRGTEGVDGTT